MSEVAYMPVATATGAQAYTPMQAFGHVMGIRQETTDAVITSIQKAVYKFQGKSVAENQSCIGWCKSRWHLWGPNLVSLAVVFIMGTICIKVNAKTHSCVLLADASLLIIVFPYACLYAPSHTDGCAMVPIKHQTLHAAGSGPLESGAWPLQPG